MPPVSRFEGIVIIINPRDHPPPHFHGRYAEFWAMVGMRTLHVISGRLPPRVEREVRRWGRARAAELERAWNLAQTDDPLP